LANSTTNEAIQINLLIQGIRKRLLRMAPWNMSLKTVNLVFISSAPGTPENTSAPTTLWQPGQPTPPWGYEYQYPVDCLRACFIIPATQTGFAAGIPITTAVTGGAASFWQGPPVKFKIQNDQFFAVTVATVQSGGTLYQLGDIITLPIAPNTSPPIGAPVQLVVTAVAGGGAITSVDVVASVIDSNPSLGGAYFAKPTNPVQQASTTGVGISATFNLTLVGPASQRVILTNQEFATLTYVQDITDPNVMDDEFQQAWADLLGAEITIPLTGDKKLANLAIGRANSVIAQARVSDGNEGFTVNDITPDWIRIRGIDFASPYSGPYTGFDWGGLYPLFG
jgi:hypothetical protein